MLDTEEHPDDVHTEDAFEVGDVELTQGRDRARDAGVVEEPVETTAVLNTLLEERPDLVLVGDVGSNGESLPAGGVDRGDGLAQLA